MTGKDLTQSVTDLTDKNANHLHASSMMLLVHAVRSLMTQLMPLKRISRQEVAAKVIESITARLWPASEAEDHPLRDLHLTMSFFLAGP